MTTSFNDAFRTAAENKAGRDYPNRSADRCDGGWLWPHVSPGFSIERGASIFTIGSCFARNIEEALMPLGFTIPTRALVTPEIERGPHRRPNGVLNEFNPGTMQQRILSAFTARPFPEDTLVPGGGGLTADLLIVNGVDVPYERALERRQQIADVYSQLPASQITIITLGLIETWFDRAAGLFLNRMPPVPVMKAQPDRFVFRVLELSDCIALLEPGIDTLVRQGIRVILTVSPVPLQTTMTASDAVMANETSKATLRLCAEHLCRRFRGVDYFPSYEIVRSGGLQSYEDDNLHVKSDLVHRITRSMIDAYCARAEAAA